MIYAGSNLLASLCCDCPRMRWCTQSVAQQCAVPPDPLEARRFFSELERRSRPFGGVGPRALPPVIRAPVFGPITHLHTRSRYDHSGPWPLTLGVRAREVVHLRDGCRVHAPYMEGRNLVGRHHVLVITGRDDWLRSFLNRVADPFYESVKALGFSAIIGPNLSAYPNAEHRVWLENRSLAVRFMERMLEWELPGVFFTYLEDSEVHQEWLTEYLRLNPTQSHIATGFDNDGANDIRFVMRRLEMLSELEQRVGRELKVVLSNMLTRTEIVRWASELFPGRLHLVAGSVFQRSVQGSRLVFAEGKVDWEERTKRFLRVRPLADYNFSGIEAHLRKEAPALFTDSAA